MFGDCGGDDSEDEMLADGFDEEFDAGFSPLVSTLDVGSGESEHSPSVSCGCIVLLRVIPETGNCLMSTETFDLNCDAGDRNSKIESPLAGRVKLMLVHRYHPAVTTRATFPLLSKSFLGQRLLRGLPGLRWINRPSCHGF